MTEEFKKKWTAALRSGEYKQGVGCLHNRTKQQFCCIGVGCDLIDPKAWCITAISGGDDELCGFVNYGEVLSTGAIPTQKWLANHAMARGLHAVFENEHIITDLVKMNDHGYTFAEIANHIDQHIVTTTGEDNDKGT